jgi:hypothetical protein
MTSRHGRLTSGGSRKYDSGARHSLTVLC